MRFLLAVCVTAAAAAGFIAETILRASAATTGAGGAVYTANDSGSSVSALDGDSLVPVHADIAAVGRSSAVAVSPDGMRVYSVGRGVDRLTVIDATTNEPVTSIGVLADDDLADLVVSGTSVWATGRQYGVVYEFDTTTNMRGRTYAMASASSGTTFPDAIDASPDGAFLFIVATADSTVQKMRTSDGVVPDTQAVGVTRELAVSADGTTLVVVGDDRPEFLATGSLDPVAGPVASDLGTQVDVAAAGSRFYVLNEAYSEPVQPGKGGPRAAPAPGSPSVDVYDAATGAYVESFDLGGGSTVLGIAVTADGSCAYVSRAGSENVGSVTRIGLTDGTIGPTGDAGGTPRRVALKEILVTTPIESFFLPRKLDVKFKGEGKDTLAASGTYDDGGATVDYAQPVTIQIGGYSKTFTATPKGANFVFKDANTSVKLKPSLKGSSRGLFKLNVRKSTLDGVIDVTQPVELRFTATGLPDAGGEVLLTAGRYRIQKVRGALVSPGFFPVKAKAKLGEGAVDTLTLLGGFATDGEAPGALTAVRIGFGPAFSRTIPGASFKGKNGVFTYASPAGPEKLKIVIDFPRERLIVTAKKVELGALASPTLDVTFDAGGGKGAFRTTIRVAGGGDTRVY